MLMVLRLAIGRHCDKVGRRQSVICKRLLWAHIAGLLHGPQPSPRSVTSYGWAQAISEAGAENGWIRWKAIGLASLLSGCLCFLLVAAAHGLTALAHDVCKNAGST
jgi:hypothetical protein